MNTNYAIFISHRQSQTFTDFDFVSGNIGLSSSSLIWVWILLLKFCRGLFGSSGF